MKKLFLIIALLTGAVCAFAQETEGDLYHGLTKKLTFDRMIPPYGLEVTIVVPLIRPICRLFCGLRFNFYYFFGGLRSAWRSRIGTGAHKAHAPSQSETVMPQRPSREDSISQGLGCLSNCGHAYDCNSRYTTRCLSACQALLSEGAGTHIPFSGCARTVQSTDCQGIGLCRPYLSVFQTLSVSLSIWGKYIGSLGRS